MLCVKEGSPLQCQWGCGLRSSVVCLLGPHPIEVRVQNWVWQHTRRDSPYLLAPFPPAASMWRLACCIYTLWLINVVTIACHISGCHGPGVADVVHCGPWLRESPAAAEESAAWQHGQHVSRAVPAANIASCACRLDPVTGALVGCYFHAHRPQDGQWLPASHTPLSEEGAPLAYVAKHAHGLYCTVRDRLMCEQPRFDGRWAPPWLTLLSMLVACNTQCAPGLPSALL